jgi:DegV family protein with EDD domain
MNEMAVRIVTDSSADLPPELAERWNITVIPCNVMLGDIGYKDGVDISPDDLYRHLTQGNLFPTTSQPSAADFQPVYKALLDQGHSILSIHLSAKLSGTFNSAEQAKASSGESAKIQIIDSQLASIPMGLVVLSAAELAEDGASLEDVASKVAGDLPLTKCYFLLDTLEYLQKGGRIGKAQAFVGSILNVRPILGLEDGTVLPIERSRNRQRGLRRLLELAHQEAPLTRLAVIHSTEPLMARGLRQELSDLLPEDQIVSARFGATLGTYIGPGAVGVALTRAG